jgi:hypothetical protein
MAARSANTLELKMEEWVGERLKPAVWKNETAVSLSDRKIN